MLIPLVPICGWSQKANDAKRQPEGTVKRENNKVVKPEGWQPPYHGDLL